MSLSSVLRRILRRLPPMRERTVQCMGTNGLLHRIAYVEWGEPDNPRVLICAHGLTRNGRDFDFLARAMAVEYRVVCPDVVGRGRSDWLQSAEGYGVPLYSADMVTLIARLDVEQVDWVGTSMGGLIGMVLASQPGSPIRKLVLNDVGPLVTAESLKRIGEYVGRAPTFADIDEAEKYIRTVSAPFGQLSDAQWRHLTEHSIRRREDGRIELSYDPQIGAPFRNAFSYGNIDLWPVYDAIRCPTLVLRGEHSDLLTRETAEQMTQRGPRARSLEVPHVGHAPVLMDPEQIDPVRSFLLS